jgi:uncharacterized protein YdeI (YjbR/CyaY-like superfamily)
MSKIDSEAREKISAYIEKANGEQKEILNRLRVFLLQEEFAITEDWKWGAPNYNSTGMICWLAYFKNHVGVNFFKGSLIEDLHGMYDEACMGKGNRQIKFRSLDDVDETKLKHFLYEAIKLNKEGTKVEAKKIVTDIPEDLGFEFESNPNAKVFFESLADSYKRDYVEWITTAKQEKTRLKRLNTTIEWLSEGKKKNWKYEKC